MESKQLNSDIFFIEMKNNLEIEKRERKIEGTFTISYLTNMEYERKNIKLVCRSHIKFFVTYINLIVVLLGFAQVLFILEREKNPEIPSNNC